MTTLRARFDGKVLVPLEPVDLPVDRELRIHITKADPALPVEYRPGSPAAILRVMREGPHVSREDVDELERLIAEDERSRLWLRPGLTVEDWSV